LTSLVNSEQAEDVVEGEEKYYIGRHKYYERDPAIIAKKKQKELDNDELFCEVCSFHFVWRYGMHGRGFIECHHLTPIAGNGIRLTREEDLALVCSNCHRMLHRKNQVGTIYSINELKELYKH
jgi:predicted HNH restriction endonuclease